jgi:hypothetical protein
LGAFSGSYWGVIVLPSQFSAEVLPKLSNVYRTSLSGSRAKIKAGGAPGLKAVGTREEHPGWVVDTFMRKPSFHAWLENRPPEVPDIGNLALVIARSGTAGVSRDALLRSIKTSPETLETLLRALVTARQVTVVQAGGEMRHRATM